MDLKTILEPYISYLKNQSLSRTEKHKFALTDIHQDLVGRRGIDLLDETAFIQFMDQCRKFLNEEVDAASAAFRAGLSRPYPKISDDTESIVYSEMDLAIPSVSDVLEYFKNFAENRGKPQLQALVDRLHAQVTTERQVLMHIKKIEFAKFFEVAKRDEAMRLRQLPTYFDDKLWWLKSRRSLVWAYALFITIGSLSGLISGFITVVCGGAKPLQCYSSYFHETKSNETPILTQLATSTPTPAITATPIPTMTISPVPTNKPVTAVTKKLAKKVK